MVKIGVHQTTTLLRKSGLIIGQREGVDVISTHAQDLLNLKLCTRRRILYEVDARARTLHHHVGAPSCLDIVAD